MDQIKELLLSRNEDDIKLAMILAKESKISAEVMNSWLDEVLYKDRPYEDNSTLVDYFHENFSFIRTEYFYNERATSTKFNEWK